MPAKTMCALVAMLFCFSAIAADKKPLTPEQKLASDAFEILGIYCGKCHGKGGANSDRMLLDRDWLFEEGLVVKGNPGGSDLYTIIEEGDMPPRKERVKLPGGKFPAEGLRVIKEWIEAGAPSPPPPPSNGLITNENILKLILADLEKTPENERPLIRYFTLSHLYNANERPSAMDNYRTALSKLVNSLTWRKTIKNPKAIDGNETILRIKLTDYEWNEDLWDEIIIKQYYPYPYVVDYPYPEHEKIRKLTASSVPFVRADWFIANGAKPELYHAILGLPKTAQELEQVKLNLRDGLGNKILNGVNEQRNGENPSFMRAGFLQSGVSKFNRIVERHGSGDSYYWKSYDFSSNKKEQNIFRFPLGPKFHFPNGQDKLATADRVELFPKSFRHAGGEIIFSLPNGLQGYLLVDDDGDRIDEAPIEIVQNLAGGPDDEPQISNGLSCMTCHTRGMRAFNDRANDLRSIIEIADAARVARNFDKNEALRIYSKPEDINRQVESDAQQFLEAVEKTGGVVGSREPIAVLANHYESSLNLPLAAGELGVSTNSLAGRIRASTHLQEYALHALLVENGPGLARGSWEKNYKAIFDRVISDDNAAPQLEFPFTFHAFSKEQKSSGSFTPIKGLAWSQKALTGEIFSAGLVDLEEKEGVVQLQQQLFQLRKGGQNIGLNQIVKWDTANWQPRFPDAPIIINNILRDIDSMAFSPVDPTKLAVSGHLLEKDNKVRLTKRFFVEIFDLNRPSKAPVTIEAGDFSNNVGFFAWSPDGKKIAVVSREFAIIRVQVHDVGTGEVHRFTSANQIKKLATRKFPGFIGGIDWSPDGKMLAISVNAGAGPSLEIWDADLEGNLDEPAQTIALDISSVKALDWGPNNLRKVDKQFDSKIALAGLAGNSSRLNIIHVGSGKIKEANKKINVVTKKEKFDAHLIGGVQDMVLAWSPDGQRLSTGIFSNHQGAPGFRIPPGAKNGFGEIKIWDTENFEKELDTLEVDQRSVQIFGRGVPQTLSSGVVSLAWRKDKKMLAAGIQDGTIRVFDKIK